GIMVGPKAMRLAIEKAQRVGVGVVTVFNSGHFGAIGHYAVQAAEQGMVGVCFTGAGLSVVPTFAAKPLLGTNPIALAAPARHEAPMLFDAATSAIAGNKIRLAIRVGSPLLPGWVSDKEGIPIMEEKPVFDRDEYHQAPLGGTREQGSHKGYGFALMAEVLSTVRSGALPTMLAAGSGSKNHFAAYNIEAFTDPEQFKHTMDGMLKTLRTATPAPGQERVLYPGLSGAEEHPRELGRAALGGDVQRGVIAVPQDALGIQVGAVLDEPAHAVRVALRDQEMEGDRVPPVGSNSRGIVGDHAFGEVVAPQGQRPQQIQPRPGPLEHRQDARVGVLDGGDGERGRAGRVGRLRGRAQLEQQAH